MSETEVTVVSIVVMVLIFVALLLLMRAGWRRRAVRTGAAVPGIPGVPDVLGAPLGPPIEATYVSTTSAGDWLDRIVAHDLGVRSAAVVTVHENGVVLARQGARDVFVPARSLVAVERTPGMAGKYVGGEGLVVLRWRATAGTATTADDSEALLDTGLRTRRAADRDVLTNAVRGLLQTTPSPSSEEHP